MLLELASILVASATASTGLDLRYNADTLVKNSIEPRARYSASITDEIQWAAGAGLTFSDATPNRLAYQGELEGSWFELLRARLRLTHLVLLSDSTSASHLLFGLEPFLRIGSWGEVAAFVGWYERFRRVSNALPVPWIARSDVREHDFALALRTDISLTARTSASLSVSTFDEIDVYNISNPYLEARGILKFPDSGWAVAAYSRYQVLLGFGRLQRIVLGVAFSLTPQSSPES